MKSQRPATPLIREGADLRPHHTLLDGQANSAIFGGWGVRFAGKVWQMLLHHVDVHVRTLEGPRRLFDALMPALGLSSVSEECDCIGYRAPGTRQPFVGIMLDDEHVPGSMRVAFAADSPEHVDRLAQLISKNGATAIEGPQYWTEYSADYYAVFFEDDNGNKYEICHRNAS